MGRFFLPISYRIASIFELTHVAWPAYSSRMAIRPRAAPGKRRSTHDESRRSIETARHQGRTKWKRNPETSAFSATEFFLYRLANLMLAAGIDAPRFMEAAGAAFVAAAAEASRLRNRRVNQSAVAAMTGLPRTEVKRLIGRSGNRGAVNPGIHRQSGIEKVIFGWISDAEFLNSRKKPRPLDRGKGRGTFDALVVRYGLDVPTAAVLRELKRRTLVRVSGSKIELIRQQARLGMDTLVRRATESLSSLLQEVSPEAATKTEIARHECKIELSDAASAQLLKTHIEESIPMFFERAGVAAGSGLRSRPPRRRESSCVSIQIFTISRKTRKK
jgi:hypothetical protein